MFCFNFIENEKDKEDILNSYVETVEIKPVLKEIMRWSDTSINPCLQNVGDKITIKTIPKEYLHKNLEEDDDLNIKKAENSHSDLISGTYEGGLKIWECTFDLGKYLLSDELSICLEKKNVLDLGCGAGLLGILTLKLGANEVDFQDYNSGVIKHLTIPNVMLNFSNLPKSRYWSGDWGGFNQQSYYDLILTSETIYNPAVYSKLHQLLKNSLKPSGLIILAAKSYYFGVGGSVAEFLSYVENEDVFEHKQVWCSSEGVKREIVELQFKK